MTEEEKKLKEQVTLREKDLPRIMGKMLDILVANIKPITEKANIILLVQTPSGGNHILSNITNADTASKLLIDSGELLVEKKSAIVDIPSEIGAPEPIGHKTDPLVVNKPIFTENNKGEA
jgi:hypothetical protein